MNSKLVASKVTARFNVKRRLPYKLPHGLRYIFRINMRWRDGELLSCSVIRLFFWSGFTFLAVLFGIRFDLVLNFAYPPGTILEGGQNKSRRKSEEGAKKTRRRVED